MYLHLDTNIILLDHNNLTAVAEPGTVVVLSETVIDELDSKKSALGEIGYQSRAFGRLLAKSEKLSTEQQGPLTVTKFKVDDIEVQIVSCSNYPNFDDTNSSIINDRKIIHAAEMYHKAGEPTTFMSNDVMARLRAESVGLSTAELQTVDKIDFQFTKTLDLPFDIFSSCRDKPIAFIDPDYKPENYNYLLTSPDTAQVKLATVINGSISILGPTTEKDLRQQDISPMNSGQLFLARAIQDKTVDVVVVDAKAGSGKTISALSNAIKVMRKDNSYESLIYIRNTVDDYGAKDEEVGFLSGNDEKMAIYLGPFYDTIHSIVRARLSNSKEKGKALTERIEKESKDLIDKHNMQAIPALGLRGRTFDNAIIIIDEAQNFSNATMVKVLSRVGKNCKVIITGSLKQIDSAYITKHTSALSVLLNAASQTHEDVKMHAVTLDKVLRGPITEWSEKVFSKH
jgi:PhoH-like ATPase